MLNLKNDVVVITGAASGIGRELAIQLANFNCHLALCDIDAIELKRTTELTKSNSNKIKSWVIDVSQQEAVSHFAEEVINYFGYVDRVINNAGKTGGTFINDLSIKDFKLILDINFYGTLYCTKAFLPHLLNRPTASIVNVASVNSFIPFPTNGAYNCSKYAVLGLSETLQQELANSNVTVTSVHPGGVKTNILKNSNKADETKTDLDLEEAQEQFHKITLTSAQQAAGKIIKAMRKKKKRVLIGVDAKFMSFVKRLLPTYAVTGLGKISMRMQYAKEKD